MKRVERYQTADGALHHTYERAKQHAEDRFHERIRSLAHRAVHQYKYTGMFDFIRNNLDELLTLGELRADITLEEDEE